MRLLSLLAALLTLAPAGAGQTLQDRATSRTSSPTLPDGFFLVDVAGGAGFELPVASVGAPNGDLYVVEKAGRVRVVRDGAVRPQPFVDLRDEVLGSDDRGLLGFALDPDFAANRYVYLSYVVAEDGRELDPSGENTRQDAFARVTRYTATPDGGHAVPGSRRVLIGETWRQGIPACYYSHTIGTLQFGRDGSLLVGTGDAAQFNGIDAGGRYAECFGAGPEGQERFPASEDIGAFRSQRLESLAGKILRVDPATGLGLPDNPFWTGDASDNASRVWALGLRNPYRFTVGPGEGPGTLHVADVGFQTWEELSEVRRGDNLGWPCLEGPAEQPGYQAATPATNGCATVGATVAPRYWWNHADPADSNPPGRVGFAAIGGPVYAGTRYPEAYRDRLFYSEFATGWLATSAVGPDGALSDDALFASDLPGVVHTQYNPATQWLTLTTLSFDGPGRVWELRHTSGEHNSAPVVQLGASPRQGTAPLEVTFSGSASSDPDGDAVSYAWAFGDGATSALADPVHVYTEPGTYTARLTVSDGFGASASSATEIVVRAGQPPTAAILSPPPGTVISAADLESGAARLELIGEGTDPDQPAETLSYGWDVALLHNSHVHPDAFSASGPTATYTVGAHGAGGDFYAVRIRLTVTDAEGLAATAERLVPFEYADGTLPPGWTAETLGAPAVEGASFLTETGAFRVRGSGDLWGLDDAAEIATRTLAGDGTVTARVASVTGGDPEGGAKAGVMIRPDGALDARGAYALMYLSPGAGLYFQWREGAGQETQAAGQPDSPASAWVRLERRGDRVRGFSSPDGAVWTLVGEATLPLGDAVRAGLAVTATDIGFDGLVANAIFTDVGVTARAAELPPFVAADLGATQRAGSTTEADGTITLRASGDLWGRDDAAHLAYWRLDGDGALTARLDTLVGGRADGHAKAGVMIRRALGPRAPYALMASSATHGLRFQHRPTAGASTESADAAPPSVFPVWLRAERVGGEVIGSHSPDGLAWTELGRATVPLGEQAVLALAATATDYDYLGLLAEARFSQVEIEGAASKMTRDEAVRAGLAAELRFGITSVFPNPTRGATRVRLDVAEGGRLTVAVFDALGRRLAEHALDEPAPGARTVALDLAGLSPGVYVVRAVSPSGEVATGRVTVVR